MKQHALLVVATLTLSACGAKLSDVGRIPQLSSISTDVAYPAHTKEDFALTSQDAGSKRYSTWNKRGSSLFLGSRAADVGDIITVEIRINDRASVTNASERARTNDRNIGFNATIDAGTISGAANGSANLNGGSSFSGDGSIRRAEQLNVRLPVVVREVLPSGNLLVEGSQEVLINAEMRLLRLVGIIRPSDIRPDNTIQYDRVAEARMSYGGQGRISEVQQPSYGQQIVDQLAPY